MAETCADSKPKNLGRTKCTGMLQLPRTIIEVPADFEFDADGDELVLAKWQEKLLGIPSVRIYKFPNFIKFEDVSQAAAYEDGPLGIIPVFDGNYRFRAYFKEGLCLHKKMFSHRNNSSRYFLADVEGQIQGTTKVNGKFTGLLAQLFHTEKMILSDGASISSKSPVFLALANNKEVDETGELIKVSFLDEMYRIIDVEMSVVSTANNKLVVNILQSCDSVAVSGLLLADFIFLKADGTAQTAFTTVVESTTIPGQYTFNQAGTTWVTGTLQLRATSLLTIKAYEQPIAQVITIT